MTVDPFDPASEPARASLRIRCVAPRGGYALVVGASRCCNRGPSRQPADRKALHLSIAVAMLDELPTTADLLTAWRDATRAPDLARRLAEVAEQTAVIAVADSEAAAEVAALAESAAQAATEAAAKARATADRMKLAAHAAQGKGRDDAAADVAQTRDDEATARDR